MLPGDSPAFAERPEHKPAHPICTCCPWRLLVSPALKRLVSVALIVNQLALIARALPYTVFYAVPNFLESDLRQTRGRPLGTTSGATGGVRTHALSVLQTDAFPAWLPQQTWRTRVESNNRFDVLQTSALPLGYSSMPRTIFNISRGETFSATVSDIRAIMRLGMS